MRSPLLPALLPVVAVVAPVLVTVSVTSGEGNPRNSHSSGRGVYKSIDGGATWSFMGLKETHNVHRILIHPRDPNVVFVAATGSAWGDSPQRGVFKSQDGGTTWEHVLSIGERTGCAELVMDPSNPDKLFAAMWSFRRQPWTFKSGGEGSGLYVTHDGGNTWEERTSEDGLPEGELGRMGLAISPANPDVVYALVESSDYALYRSDAGGLSFPRRSTDNEIGNRPFYYAEIHADPSAILAARMAFDPGRPTLTELSKPRWWMRRPCRTPSLPSRASIPNMVNWSLLEASQRV